jgi:hypothetical protein
MVRTETKMYELFPLKKDLNFYRSLSVHRPLGGPKAPSYEKTTQLLIANAKNDVLIEINDSCCKLLKATNKVFTDVLEIEMSPAQLLYVLQRRGINFLPSQNDFEKILSIPQPYKKAPFELAGNFYRICFNFV